MSMASNKCRGGLYFLTMSTKSGRLEYANTRGKGGEYVAKGSTSTISNHANSVAPLSFFSIPSPYIYTRSFSVKNYIVCIHSLHIHTYFLLSACNRGILIRSFVAPRSRKRVSRETSMNQVTTIVIDNWPRKVWCLVNERLR